MPAKSGRDLNRKLAGARPAEAKPPDGPSLWDQLKQAFKRGYINGERFLVTVRVLSLEFNHTAQVWVWTTQFEDGPMRGDTVAWPVVNYAAMPEYVKQPGAKTRILARARHNVQAQVIDWDFIEWMPQ